MLCTWLDLCINIDLDHVLDISSSLTYNTMTSRYLGLPTPDDNLRGYQASDVNSKAKKLANKKSYLLAYSFLGLFQSMFFSYSIATLTTLEKQFKLNSQTTGSSLL